MFFFLGWGNKKSKDLGRVVPINCPNCKNNTFLKLLEAQEYVSFFFVPLSSGSKYFLACEICSRGLELKNKYLEKAKKLMAITTEFLNKAIPQDRYENIVREEDLIGEINRENDRPGITKICSNCGKGYDSSWKVCLECSVPLRDKGASLSESK